MRIQGGCNKEENYLKDFLNLSKILSCTSEIFLNLTKNETQFTEFFNKLGSTKTSCDVRLKSNITSDVVVVAGQVPSIKAARGGVS